MIALDTNVLLRHLVQDDDPTQTERVRAALEAALAEGHELLIPLVVTIETVWVLRRTVGLSRRRVAAIIAGLLELPDIRLAESDLVRAALERYQTGGADFSDYVIEAEAKRLGAARLLTLDRLFARGGGLPRLVT